MDILRDKRMVKSIAASVAINLLCVCAIGGSHILNARSVPQPQDNTTETWHPVPVSLDTLKALDTPESPKTANPDKTQKADASSIKKLEASAIIGQHNLRKQGQHQSTDREKTHKASIQTKSGQIAGPQLAMPSASAFQKSGSTKSSTGLMLLHNTGNNEAASANQGNQPKATSQDKSQLKQLRGKGEAFKASSSNSEMQSTHSLANSQSTNSSRNSSKSKSEAIAGPHSQRNSLLSSKRKVLGMLKSGKTFASKQELAHAPVEREAQNAQSAPTGPHRSSDQIHTSRVTSQSVAGSGKKQIDKISSLHGALKNKSEDKPSQVPNRQASAISTKQALKPNTRPGIQKAQGRSDGLGDQASSAHDRYIGQVYHGSSPVNGLANQPTAQDPGSDPGTAVHAAHLPTTVDNENPQLAGPSGSQTDSKNVVAKASRMGILTAEQPGFTIVPVDIGSTSIFGSVPWGDPITGGYKDPNVGKDGMGLLGSYYVGQNFEQFVFKRADSNINYIWTGTGPGPLMPPRQPFSVRWTGELVASYTEPYTIMTASDDGVRVYLNGSLIIDNWTVHAMTEDTATVDLVANQPNDIVVEYFEKNGMSNEIIKLYWESKHQPLDYITERSLLYPRSD